MVTRINDFSHIVPVSKIDITVGTRAPRVAEVDRTARVPISGDVRPMGRFVGSQKQSTTPIRTLSLDKGFIVDVFA